jgi:membrane fusion protein (multidrug efflux system)
VAKNGFPRRDERGKRRFPADSNHSHLFMNFPDRNGVSLIPETESRHLSSQKPAHGGGGGGFKYLVLGVCVIAGLVVAGMAPRWKSRQGLAEQKEALAVPYVTVILPKVASKESKLTLPGEVRAMVEAPIYARTSGYLKRWLVDIGSNVKTGELLAEIEAPEVDQQLLQARAQLIEAEAAAKLARATANRYDALRKTAVVSAQDQEEKAAQAATSEATVEAARANVQKLTETQSFERVTAPFDGIITDRGTDIGQLINAGAGQALFRLAQADTLRIYVRAPQGVSHEITPDMTADLTLPEMPGRAFEAKVVRTAGAIDVASRTLLVELQVDNKKGEIFAGSHAEISFKLKATNAAFLVPSNALLFRSEGPQVGVVDDTGHVELRTIKLGRDFGREIEVLTGLKPQDRIIVNPSDSLTAGVSVNVAKKP